jgi:hypothetical protein
MRIAAKAIASVVVLTSAVLFTNGFASAKDQKYLLNCKLMDQSDLLFKRYCNGEKPDSKIVCQGDYCLIVVTNFGSGFSLSHVIIAKDSEIRRCPDRNRVSTVVYRLA